MPRPRSVVASVWLQVGNLVLGVLSYVVGGAANGYAGIGIGFTVFFVLVIGFWLLVAWATWLGKPWARMVQTVLLPLQIGVAVLNAAAANLPSDALDYLACALSAAAVILLWVPTSRRFFAAMKAARPPPKPVKPYLDPKNR